MDAMLLAAGLGTRLRPLTNRIPKALVEVDGVPMLERVARRVLAAGFDRILVNTAHLGEQVEAYVAGAGWDAHVETIHEPGGPYETGGGLKHGADFFTPGEPFLLHNADILTTADLVGLFAAQRDATDGRLATLACKPAESGRYLVFDEGGLAGYAIEGEETLMREAQGEGRKLDFCGVQAAGDALLEVVRDVPEQTFSIMDIYLRMAKQGRRVEAFTGDTAPPTCLDMGTPERLEAAAEAVRAGHVA